MFRASGGLQQIQNREQEDPNQVDEVPEQSGNFDAVGVTFGLGLPHLCARTPNVKDHQRAADDVQRVQAGEREVNREVGIMPWTVINAGKELNWLMMD